MKDKPKQRRKKRVLPPKKAKPPKMETGGPNEDAGFLLGDQVDQALDSYRGRRAKVKKGKYIVKLGAEDKPKRHNKPGRKSAKESFAGGGEGLHAGERSPTMVGISFDSNALAVFPSREIARVRFGNEDEEAKGLGLLLSSGHTVDCYENDIYGVTSDSQLQALKDAAIRFTVL
ncbi:MAG: hypothetical protein AAB468_02865 [Patescibacteria group bacterium]